MIKNFDELKQVSAKCASCLSAKFTGEDGKRHIVLCGGTLSIKEGARRPTTFKKPSTKW